MRAFIQILIAVVIGFIALWILYQIARIALDNWLVSVVLLFFAALGVFFYAKNSSEK
jgi:hypothetical protein